MLKWLKIKNYLLIENLDIEIPDGFITITGETGAGKSILLGAVSMLTGKRADTSALLDKSLKSVIEAGIAINENMKPFFERYDLDFDTETILRREISGLGKSRAFINDTPVNLDHLKQLTGRVIDIHSQHQSLLITRAGFRLEVLDSFAGTHKELNAYNQVFDKYTATTSELKTLTEKYKEAVREKDYLQFQFDQMEKAGLEPGELETLETEESALDHAEDIQAAFRESLNAMRDDEQNCLDMLKCVRNALDNIKVHYDPASAYTNRIDSVIIELNDLAESFEVDADEIQYDPNRLAQVKERLNLLNDLLLKHQKTSLKELIQYRDEISEKLLAMDTDSSRMDDLRTNAEELYKEVISKGVKLRKKRRDAVKGFENKLTGMLSYLGMHEAVFKVRMEERETPAANGLDMVDFLFTANKDISPHPIAKVASGGEMSRLMLCLKTIIAEKLSMSSIIFDEIDSGVSGNIAGKMGNMMLQLANKAQVINITHLAQVAALGSVQFHVEKNKQGITIKKLTGEQRLMEIARMSSGENLSDAAVEHARNLLQQPVVKDF
ncbi:MAG: DNA repair protein RecN [Bacteroidales bacterium]